MSGPGTVTDPLPFDLCGELPSGVTVLEASAGTGKTYTIAALAARFVAAGASLDELLLVTFTRMATGELRDRVRERLVSAERGLQRVLATGRADTDDPILNLLATGTPEEVELRRDRLARALADFDAATIATTHGFCQEVLGGLGVTGDVEPDTVFVEDVSDLVDEVVDDLYVRRFHGEGDPPFDRAHAMRIARAAVDNPMARIEPAMSPEHLVPAMRRRFAHAVRGQLEKRKRQMGVMTYDDLLTRLQGTLDNPETGPAAAERLRRRFRVVLVDEFQDTDPVQWDILRRAFGGGGVTLILIGDPKQAIYAFRGADVYAYLEAAREAGTIATLQTNYRSDQGLLDAYDALFGGAKLGHEGIEYRQVRACDANVRPRLTGAPNSTPLRIRVVDRDDPTVGTTPGGYARKNPAREHVAKDLACDLVALLNSDAEVEAGPRDGRPRRRERIRCGHVAVLVRRNIDAALVRDELEAVGIPAVINGAGSVFGTTSARDWLRLLEAIERPSNAPRARTAALTPFLGWTSEDLASAGEEGERRWEDLHQRLHRWARVLRTEGVASLMETIFATERVPGRVLALNDGERRLTDLRHVGQLLHAAATSEQMGPAALTAWLRQRIDAAEDETSDEERSRRLESDAEAVQVLTIHRSKGLEFPIVYCPYLWMSSYVSDDPRPIFFHDPEHDDARTIDVGLEGSDYRHHRELHLAEQRGEDLRLAYVALTRAQHQAVVWWAGSWDSRDSPLSRLLWARDRDGNVHAKGPNAPSDAKAIERFEALGAAAPGCVSVEKARLRLPENYSPAPVRYAELSAGTFDRELDRRWRRTSFSDITAGAYDAKVGSEPEEPETDDEDIVAVEAAPRPRGPADGDGLAEIPSLLADLPTGRQAGTLVHRVLEAADFAAADLEAELTEQVVAAQARRAVPIAEPDDIVAGLRAALETPLGPVAGDIALRDVTRENRLDELTFELPLAGGDRPSGDVTLRAVARALARHLPDGDPLAGYAARLDDPALRSSVRGYLTGSIDLVLRVPGGDGTSRFAIVDYKTNWLAGPEEELSVWHYRPEALVAEMQHSHYALQALLYTVALHRYLRWRMPGYDPERNLAGILYLFLRGMRGPETPVVGDARCGVFAWRPPVALIEELSLAFEGEGPA